MRGVLFLAWIAAILCGCSGNPAPAPTASKERLPLEVEKSPEEALPKKSARKP
jgi:hypothetical protein